jgi:hypothetical protein
VSVLGAWKRRIPYLAVVECAIHGQIVHIRVHDRGHLRFLYRTDLAVGEHYKDRDILLPAEAVDGGRTSITTCCADDSQVLPTSSSLALVPANQEVLEQIAQKL